MSFRLTVVEIGDDKAKVECSCGAAGIFRYTDSSIRKQSWYYCDGCSSEYNLISIENKEAPLTVEKK